MQNFLNLLSIIAFVMSLITWICTAINKSIRLSFEIKDQAKRHGSIVQLFLYIQNNSGRSVTISGLSIVTSSKKYPCDFLSKTIRTRDEQVIVQTANLPVNFAPYQGMCLAFEFLDCQDIELTPGKTIDLEFYTNRQVLKRSLILCPEDHVLHF